MGTALGDMAATWVGKDCRPAVVVNFARQVRWANAAAVELLRAPQALYLRSGCLCLADQRSTASFDEALAHIGSSPEKIPVTDKAGRMAMIVTASSHGVGDQRFLLLVIKTVAASLNIATANMARIFALTPAEAQILTRLGSLEAPAEIAKNLGISVHTVRTHVRNLYNKTSVHSDLELLRLTLAFQG